MSDRESVPIALRAAMSYRDVSPQQLAAALGVNKHSVYRWARGEHALGLDDAQAISRVLRLPGDLLIYPPATRDEAMAVIAEHDRLSAPPTPDPALGERAQAWAESEDARSRPPRPARPSGTGRR